MVRLSTVLTVSAVLSSWCAAPSQAQPINKADQSTPPPANRCYSPEDLDAYSRAACARQLATALAEAQKKYTPDHPDVKRLQRIVNELESPQRMAKKPSVKDIGAAKDASESHSDDYSNSNQPSPAVSINSTCPSTMLSYWNGDSDYPYLSKQGLFSNYFEEFKNWQPANVASVSSSFRTCLGRALSSVRSSDHRYMYSDFQVSDLISAGPHLLMLQALSHLYAPRRADQNPLQAATLVQETLKEYVSNIDGVRTTLAERERELQQQQREAEAREQARFNRDQRNQVIGAVVGGLLLKKYADAPSSLPSQMVQNAANSAQRYHEFREKIISQSARKVDQVASRLASLEVPHSWSEDGVRIHVVRFDDPYNSHGPVQPIHDHTRYIVRVLVGDSMCTGALVGPRLVLTAQHCLYDENGKQRPGLVNVQWESFELDRSQGLVPQSITVPVSQWTTSSSQWHSTWSGDWALLEIKTMIHKNIGYLDLVRPDDLPKILQLQRRVAIAGYSADIDDGEFITMDWGCAVVSSANGILNHQCKAWKGASGSPIVISEGPQKGSIAAIHSFGRSDDQNHRQGGGPTTEQFYAEWKKLVVQQTADAR